MILHFKGGTGSGNFGHAGRIGKVGGSSKAIDITNHASYVCDRFGVYPKIEVLKSLSDITSGGAYGVYKPETDTIYLNNSIITRLSPTGEIPSGGIKNLAQLGWQFLVTHEIGHSFDIAEGSPSLKDEWKYIADKYHTDHELDFNGPRDEYGYRNTDGVISVYSMIGLGYSQYLESFAEAFAAYVHVPDWLSETNPDMYNYMQRLELGNG